MRSLKLAWSLVALLSLVVAFFAYKFTAGEAQPSQDGRMEIQLTQDERNTFLLEMRTWMQSTQAIMAALSQEDYAAVAQLAKAAGMEVEEATPAVMFKKIPLPMKKLGFDTRAQFDAIAADAGQKTMQRTLGQLGQAMNNCIACHATYRFSDGVEGQTNL